MGIQALSVPRTMKAAILKKPLEIAMEELPVPRPGSGEVLVKVMAVGVCGSDVHYYEHGRIGPYVVESPLILGHECAGVVVACGPGVTRFRPGDRVAVEPGVTCGRCALCKAGRYNLCPHVRFLATPPVDGAFVQYLVHREDFLFAIPDSMSFEEAALIEPFSVTIHALNRAGFHPGQSAAVIGLGPVGLMTVAAARAFGASLVIGCDREAERMNAALKLGADAVVEAGQDAAREIRRATDYIGVDVALETAGHPMAVQTAFQSVRRGGRMAVIGLPADPEVKFNIPHLCDNEIEVYGIFRYANTYAQGISLMSAGLPGIRELVTDRFDLEHTEQALTQAMTNKRTSLKVFVYPNGLPGACDGPLA
jgi:Threonine dehydrogenase and related Zn-dependent dehydrogenases